MNRTELVAAIAEKSGVIKKDAESFLTATIDCITEALKNGGKVQLVEFGTFETRKRAARKGRNPQTGAEITIAEATTPIFKAGKVLKDTVK